MRNSSEKLVKDIRRRTRKKYSAEEKIRNVPLRVGFALLEGLRGEESIAELCCCEGLNQNESIRRTNTLFPATLP